MSPVPADGLPAAAREAMRARLCGESAAHSERTAATARRLAGIHGVDADAAEAAGLLHDWSRDESFDDLLAFAREADLAVVAEELAHPYLLHARVGAERLRAAFPSLSAEILHAVAAHTVGEVPMTDLDKVVYVADMIEPGRSFTGVEELRRAAESRPLAEAFAQAYAHAVDRVDERGLPLHPTTRLVVAEIEREAARRHVADPRMSP